MHISFERHNILVIKILQPTITYIFGNFFYSVPTGFKNHTINANV